MENIFNIEKLNKVKAKGFLALSMIFEEYGKLGFSSIGLGFDIKETGFKDNMPFIELENGIKITSDGCNVFYIVYFENDYIKEYKYCDTYEDAERYMERSLTI